MWSVPKASGFPTALATGDDGCALGLGNVELDATDLFYIRGLSVVRLPKTGGVPEPLGTGGAVALASDRDSVYYWLDLFDNAVKTAPKRGGAEQTLASIEITSYRRLTASGGYLYWMQPNAIARISTSAPFPAAVSALSVARSSPDDFVVTDKSIFFVSTGEDLVGSLALADGALSLPAPAEARPDVITHDNSNRYWVNTGDQAEIRKMSITGGTPSTIARLSTTSSVGRIIADATHVYWAEGRTLMRAPK